MKKMAFQGKVWKFGDDIDTDVIIPVQYTITPDPVELGKHSMEGIDPDFPRKISQGDIIVAGKNFGCGSSREPAPVSIKAAGISCIIGKSFARIFYRNAFNVGLPLIECGDAYDKIKEGDSLEIDVDTGVIKDTSSGVVLQAKPIPPFMQELLDDGGLMRHLAKKMGI